MNTDNTMRNLLKTLSPQNFLMLGINQIAYIRPAVLEDHRKVWSVHAADGTVLSIQDQADQAIMVLRSNDLAPVTLH
jgi:hypothetical protein